MDPVRTPTGWQCPHCQVPLDRPWQWDAWSPLLWTLARIGFIRISDDGAIRWPVSISPRWQWGALLRGEPFIGFFRNRPGIVKWERGRLLPRRWGIRIWFFEFGDRG